MKGLTLFWGARNSSLAVASGRLIAVGGAGAAVAECHPMPDANRLRACDSRTERPEEPLPDRQIKSWEVTQSSSTRSSGAAEFVDAARALYVV